MKQTFYCPKCGKYFLGTKLDTIQPGEYYYTCSYCDTLWQIKIEFYEDEENEQSE